MFSCFPMQATRAITLPVAPVSATVQPEFFRLPSRGGDPIFGLSRSFYYAAEKRGEIRLRRLRAAGNVRGAVLVPVAEVRRFVEKC